MSAAGITGYVDRFNENMYFPPLTNGNTNNKSSIINKIQSIANTVIESLSKIFESLNVFYFGYALNQKENFAPIRDVSDNEKSSKILSVVDSDNEEEDLDDLRVAFYLFSDWVEENSFNSDFSEEEEIDELP